MKDYFAIYVVNLNFILARDLEEAQDHPPLQTYVSNMRLPDILEDMMPSDNTAICRIISATTS